ncbi:karyopherin KAP120 Ecym_8309 [Eremothecium cymbalariae DBVPG|uniref:Importin N-terminal domain-containing protein n=1 Tax=Eremothecium cymbalariae (strain CBS 270.75 / DBVPG 7215 / KCTC 17166 / NRRL Y-17582) TaxID=931890 RepID=G8JXL3_ERECY|nr:Hypothetical protein Ecym_8309 [Eremothecium cymbalariae DBVPG\
MDLVLNELNLVQVLEKASDPRDTGSSEPIVAEEQLKLWQGLPGYHYSLQSVYLNLSWSLQVRWLAIIQFKNSTDKFWRPTRMNCISKDEKSSIRDRLFHMVNEENNQLAIQNAHATAKIARLDYPQNWPNMFEYFEIALADHQVLQNDVKVYNILVHLNQIIKVIAPARIARCRPAMQIKMPLVFPLIVRVYLTNFNKWTSSNVLEKNELPSLKISYLALKVLRRAIVDVYESPHKDQAVIEFMDISLGHFSSLLLNHGSFKTFDEYEKFIKCYCKLYYNLVNVSPFSFVLLPSSYNILVKTTSLLFDRAVDVYQENAEVTSDFWEQLAIRAFGILRAIVQLVQKKGAIYIRSQTERTEVRAAIAKLCSQFLNEELLAKLMDLLIEWYLKMRPAELEHWYLDPEDWINEQISSGYEYQIRPCAENFFHHLMNCFSDFLCPYLLTTIETESGKLSSSMDDFLKKDAMFAAFQLASTNLSKHVDFDRLLVQIFLPEAVARDSTSADRLKIIRRRLALIINDWCTVKCSADSKVHCYDFFLELLTNDSDKVVQLTVVQSLRTMVGDWDFDKDQFQPYLDEFVTTLLRNILPSTKYTETKLYVLNTLSDIVIQNKGVIGNKLLMEILQIVPELWNVVANDDTQSILANALLRLLRYLLISLGGYSHAAWSAAIPALELSCNPSSCHFSLLYEDGYELWSALLQNFDPSMAALDSRLIDIVWCLEYGVQNQTESLPTLLEIVKSYVLLLPSDQYLSINVFSSILKHASSYLLKLRDDCFDIVLSILDTLTLLNEEDLGVRLIKYFFEAGVFTALLNAIFIKDKLSSFQHDQICRPISRIAFINPTGILDVIRNYHESMTTRTENALVEDSFQQFCINRETPLDEVIKIFMSRWSSCLNIFHDSKVTKIHALGTSSMLKTGHISILTEFSSICNAWIEFMEEINEDTVGDCEKYHLTDSDPELQGYTIEQLRYNELYRTRDPVHHVNSKKFFQDILYTLQKELGSQYPAFLKTVDSVILSNLEIFLSISPQKS